MDRNTVIDQLILKKYKSEVMSDIYLTVNFFHSNRMVQLANTISYDDSMLIQEKIDKVAEIYNHMNMIIYTLKEIDTDYIKEYEKIVNNLEVELSNQQKLIQSCFELVQSQEILSNTESTLEAPCSLNYPNVFYASTACIMVWLSISSSWFLSPGE